MALQETLFSARDEPEQEEPGYLTDQLITYIGNKRALLAPLSSAIEDVQTRLGKDRLRLFDAFAGSGVVSRLFKRYASEVVSNDIENYARVIAECYLTNRNSVDLNEFRALVAQFNKIVEDAPSGGGFIERLYAPRDDLHIVEEDRVFYTKDNGRRLDTYRQLIDGAPANLRSLLLGPLLSRASVHANTAGVFKGFYKDRETGVGRFGGSGQDALSRICKPIVLEVPLLSRFECDFSVYQDDACQVAQRVGSVDLAYLDPPYNQHPYGSNYFMLNLLVDYAEPAEVSKVSGIPKDWTRSAYNVRSRAAESLKSLIANLDATFVLISYNDEGFIAPEEMRDLLLSFGIVQEITTQYNTFRGSRNLRARDIHVTEHLFILERA